MIKLTGYFQLILLLFVLFERCKSIHNCNDQAPGKTVCLRGKGGVPCGTTNCAKGEARCCRGECQCQSPNKRGIGNVCCFDPSKYDGGLLAGDRRVMTFSKERTYLPFPCRLCLTHAKTDLRIKRGKKVEKQGVCVFHVHAWSINYKGGIFVEGLDLAIRAEFNPELCGRSNKVKATFRVRGEAKNGRYVFKEWGEKDYKVHGTFNPENVKVQENGVDFQIRYDKHQNFAYFTSEVCGLHIRLRPTDRSSKAKRTFESGLCVKVNRENNPVYRSDNFTMLMTPSLSIENWILEPLDTNIGYFTHVFNPNVVQRFPCASEECQELINEISGANERTLTAVMKRCYWLFSTKEFIAQNDPESQADRTLELAKYCFRAVVKGGRLCTRFAHTLKKRVTYNGPDIPELDKWRSGHFCRGMHSFSMRAS